jgi:hypothetical protein
MNYLIPITNTMNQDQDQIKCNNEELARNVKDKPMRERIVLIKDDKNESVEELKKNQHTKNKSKSKSNTHDHGQTQKINQIKKNLLNKQSRSITTTNTTTTTTLTASDKDDDELSQSIQSFISTLSDSPFIKGGFILSLFVTNGCVHNVTNTVKDLSEFDRNIVKDVIHIQNFFTTNEFNLALFSGEAAFNKMFLKEAKTRLGQLFGNVHESPDFIVYFAGHGTENGDWVFWNDDYFKTDLNNNYTDIMKFQEDNKDWYASLTLQDIIDLWNTSNHDEKAQLTIISDSCYSGMWCNILDFTTEGRICVIAASHGKTYGNAFKDVKDGEFPFQYTNDYEFREPLCSFFRGDD